MPHVFFTPDLSFAWAFVLLLAGLMLAASWFDLRYMVIPKQVSLATLGLGLIANIIRGIWLASLGKQTWLIEEPSHPLLGGLDGFLFSLAGFATAFSIFFLLWVLNVAGGGDVKQSAAVGAWVGPLWTIYLLVVTLIFVAIIAFSLICLRFINRGVRGMFPQQPQAKQNGGKGSKFKVAQGRRVGWALPATLAVVLVMFWVLRVELGLQDQPGTETVPAKVGSNRN